jgi:ketosteroid isomerase-like protein
MSEEKVDVVRRSADAWNRTDWEALQAVYAADVVVVAPREWPEGEGAHGWEEWRLQIERLKGSWEIERVEVDEIRALANDRVFGRFSWVASGRASGAPAGVPMAAVYTVTGGRIKRVEFFLNLDAALEAAGLQE